MLRLFRGNTKSVSKNAFLDVRHAGETFRVMLKRTARARRFTLRVRAATRDVVLTIPPRGSLSAARDFAERHAGWIGARLQRLPRRVAIEPGATIPLRGIEHLIVHRPGMRGTVWIEGSAGVELHVAGGPEHVARRVTDYLKREAKRDLDAAVKRHSAVIGVAARKVTLRDSTSRWGSCSSKGSLNFSWRLIMAPPFVLDYLAAHEVAHLVHMDHSPKFWKLTRRLAPHTDRAEAWLKVHGAKLHRYVDTASD
ncbi:MAG: M48 family metallopeptidase [Methylobacteriaceae bacterium]|nr:M48 family metallopeptidase [Methylobacteriaceae bacterium]